MSIEGAMFSAVSGLQSQGSALAIISDNLANSSTNGYKANSASFTDLVTGQTSGGQYASGGVLASMRQNVGAQGLIQATQKSTDLAIDGNGMFVVSYGLGGGGTYFTRDGEFNTDSTGNMVVNGNYYLQGWPTDQAGNITAANVNNVSALQRVNLDRYNASASASTYLQLQANLPADSSIGATFNTGLQIYDSLGVSQSLPVTWTHNIGNQWTMSVANPTSPTSASTVTGTISPSPSVYTVQFNTDGSLNSITGVGVAAVNGSNQPVLSIGKWTDGATNSLVTLKLGTAGALGTGKTDGLTQYATGENPPNVDINSQSQDGVKYGKLSKVQIGNDGTVTAQYDNGQKVSIYKIPLAVFPNYDGLQATTDGVYQQTNNAGDYNLHIAGQDGAGVVRQSSLESSTVDTSSEFSKMIVAQQAYSAAAQVITAGKQMYTTLIQAVQ